MAHDLMTFDHDALSRMLEHDITYGGVFVNNTAYEYFAKENLKTMDDDFNGDGDGLRKQYDTVVFEFFKTQKRILEEMSI